MASDKDSGSGISIQTLVISALAANAIKPVPGAAASIPAMFAGWLVSELAPHVIVGTVVDSVREARRSGGRSGAVAGGWAHE